MKKQNILEKQVNFAYLSLGSNLGNRNHNIQKIKFFLDCNHINIIKSSTIYETISWPNKKFPKYYNLVVKIKTELNPIELLKKILLIEKKMGRKRLKKNEPRVCDIDILDFMGKIIKKKELTLPHPEIHKRSFVLLPFYELDKDWKHPLKKLKINELLKNLGINSYKSIKKI